MPLTKADDTERKRQRRAASPSERGRRSEWAPWSKARDANRKRQKRAPSRTSSADATGQALSKKAEEYLAVTPGCRPRAPDAKVRGKVRGRCLENRPWACRTSNGFRTFDMLMKKPFAWVSKGALWTKLARPGAQDFPP